MTFKDYIDYCLWEELKATKGVKEYMQLSLADLKRLEPKYTGETKDCTIHFSESIPDEEDKDANEKEEHVQYYAFTRQVGHEENFGVFEDSWGEMLPLEVVIDKDQTLTSSEIVAAVIWELTWMGATSDECKTAWNKKIEEWNKLTEDDFVPFESVLELLEKEQESEEEKNN